MGAPCAAERGRVRKPGNTHVACNLKEMTSNTATCCKIMVSCGTLSAEQLMFRNIIYPGWHVERASPSEETSSHMLSIVLPCARKRDISSGKAPVVSNIDEKRCSIRRSMILLTQRASEVGWYDFYWSAALTDVKTPQTIEEGRNIKITRDLQTVMYTSRSIARID